MEPPGNAVFFVGILFCLWTILAASTSQPFHLVNQVLNWDHAQRFCRVKHSDLAGIDNMAGVSKVLALLVGGPTYVWIGLRKGKSDRWVWYDGHGAARFIKWRDGEPKNDEGDDRCTEMSQTTDWNDLLCDHKREFVCYDRVNGRKQFFHIKETETWVRSQERCRDNHLDLAAIQSNGENDQVAQMIKSWTGYIWLPKKVWIGLFRDSWFWSDGRQTSFRFWLSGSGGDCAAMASTQNGRWVQTSCSNGFHFVCQGDVKVKKTVVKVKVNSEMDLTNDTVIKELLTKLDMKFRSLNLSDFKLSWRKDRRGIIFHRLEPPVVKDTGCLC